MVDTQIAQQIKRGAYEAALCQMTAQYHAALMRFCVGFIGQPMEAEEIVQEVFIQAWEALPTYRGDSTVRVWLFGIARRLCSRHLRRKNRRRSIFQRWFSAPFSAKAPAQDDALSTLPLLPSTSAHDLDGHIEAMQRQALVSQALMKLKPLLREAVLLRYQQELDNAELADALGVTAATARKRVSLGIQALRQALRPLLDEPARPPRPPARRSSATRPSQKHPQTNDNHEQWTLETLRQIGS